MEGKIYINGQIGSFDDEVGVNLIDIIKQVKLQPLATSFDVFINSEGGYVDVGFEIYDYLKSLNVPITTIGVGLVASIATVIFMAGDTRKLRTGAQFMIHLPSGEVGGTADEISTYSDMLKSTENKLVKFYTSATGLSEDAIRPLLRNETWLNNEDALSLGFSTMEEVQLQMVAKYNVNTKTEIKMTKEDKGWIEEQFTKFTALFGAKAKNIILADANGVEIDFPSVEDGQVPAVGDEGMVAGEPAEGEYIMPQLNNSTVVFVAGVITEIKEVEADDEMATLKSENEALKEQLAQATLKSTDSETKLSTMETAFTNFKASVTAKFKNEPAERITKATAPTNVAQERLAKLKNKNK